MGYIFIFFIGKKAQSDVDAMQQKALQMQQNLSK